MAEFDLIVRSGTVVTASNTWVCDVGVKDGKITKIGRINGETTEENFLVLENHSVDDIERWSGLVEGLPQPLVQDGHIEVPDTPGLGFIGLSEQALESFANPQSTTGIFSPSDQWDGERSSDRLWS